jgi:hypothetical protein
MYTCRQCIEFFVDEVSGHESKRVLGIFVIVVVCNVVWHKYEPWPVWRPETKGPVKRL